MKERLLIQPKPNVVKVELTEGCNLSCKFCAIKSIRDKQKDYKFISIKTARLIAEGIADIWEPIRVEFAMHGEPLLNPNIIKILRLYREILPKSSFTLTSNATQIANKKISIYDVLQYVNVLALDDYNTGIVKKIISDLTKKIRIYIYPEINIYSKHKSNKHYLVVLNNIGQKNIGQRKLHNTAGNSGKLDFSKINQRCYRPFRELSFKYNGNAILCCLDWKQKFIIDNIYRNSITNIWQNVNLQSARKVLYYFGRKFSICYGCNAFSAKNGLLPDKLGKLAMPIPKIKDIRNLEKFNR